MTPIQTNTPSINLNDGFFIDIEQGNFLNDMDRTFGFPQNAQRRIDPAEIIILRNEIQKVIDGFCAKAVKIRSDLRQDGLTNHQINKELKKRWEKLRSSFQEIGINIPEKIKELNFRDNFHCIEKFILCLEDMFCFCSDEIRYFFQDIRSCLRRFRR